MSTTQLRDVPADESTDARSLDHHDVLDTEELTAIVQRIAANDAPARITPGTMRRWTLAEEAPIYQAWIIAWPAGAGLGLHDHDDSRAAIHVVAGQLRERYLTADGLVARSLGPGVTERLPHDHTHEVVNVGTVEAISVHAYSPPLLDLSFRADPSIDLRADANATDSPIA